MPVPTASQLEPGDIGVSGIHAQALVSRAIKLGGILRYQPRARRAAQTAGAAVLVIGLAAVVLLVARGGWWIAVAALAAVAVVVLAIAVVWVVTDRVGDHAAWSGQGSHSFMCLRVDPDGTRWIGESVAHGVQIVKLHYRPGEYRIVRTSTLADDRDLEQVRGFWNRLVAEKAQYGRFTFAALFVYSILGGKIGWEKAGTWICSGACCDAGTRWGAMPSGVWKLTPYRMTPTDIVAQAMAEGVPVEATVGDGP